MDPRWKLCVGFREQALHSPAQLGLRDVFSDWWEEAHTAYLVYLVFLLIFPCPLSALHTHLREKVLLKPAHVSLWLHMPQFLPVALTVKSMFFTLSCVLSACLPSLFISHSWSRSLLQPHRLPLRSLSMPSSVLSSGSLLLVSSCWESSLLTLLNTSFSFTMYHRALFHSLRGLIIIPIMLFIYFFVVSLGSLLVMYCAHQKFVSFICILEVWACACHIIESILIEPVNESGGYSVTSGFHFLL